MITSSDRIRFVQEYYFSRKLQEIAKIQNPSVINLGIGNPDLPPSETTINELIESSGDRKSHGYQLYKGIPELRIAFSEWYKNSYDVTLNPDKEILPLLGSKEGIVHTSLAFLNPGDEVLVPNPGYVTYTNATRLAGAIPVTYTLNDESYWYPDFSGLAKSNLEKVKLMWVNYPHMPTGASGKVTLFQNLIEFGRTHDILICHDNPYSFILNENPLSIFTADKEIQYSIELNSLSKSHNMAGWRVGMVAGRSEYIQAILQVKSNMDSGMFLPLQKAAVKALESPPEWQNNLNLKYMERRKHIWKILDTLGCEYRKNQAGLFVWAKIPQEFENGEEYSDWLLNTCHIFIAPGFIFGSEGNKYIRMSICVNESILNEVKNRILHV